MKTKSYYKADINNLVNGERYHFNVYSLSGEKVYTKDFFGGSSVTIDKHINDGTYLMTVEIHDEVVYKDRLIFK